MKCSELMRELAHCLRDHGDLDVNMTMDCHPHGIMTSRPLFVEAETFKDGHSEVTITDTPVGGPHAR